MCGWLPPTFQDTSINEDLIWGVLWINICEQITFFQEAHLIWCLFFLPSLFPFSRLMIPEKVALNSHALFLTFIWTSFFFFPLSMRIKQVTTLCIVSNGRSQAQGIFLNSREKLGHKSARPSYYATWLSALLSIFTPILQTKATNGQTQQLFQFL